MLTTGVFSAAQKAAIALSETWGTDGMGMNMQLTSANPSQILSLFLAQENPGNPREEKIFGDWRKALSACTSGLSPPPEQDTMPTIS
jgi:hypothetical protein